jgi:hypothetical protein
MPEPTPGKRTLEYTETVGEVSRTVIAEVDDMGCILITTEWVASSSPLSYSMTW